MVTSASSTIIRIVNGLWTFPREAWYATLACKFRFVYVFPEAKSYGVRRGQRSVPAVLRIDLGLPAARYGSEQTCTGRE